MNRSSAEEIVRRYYFLVDLGDLAFLDLFHPDANYKRPGHVVFQGRPALRKFYTRERVIESGRHSISALFTIPNSVAVEGIFAGQLKDGRQVTVAFSDFFDLERVGDGLVIRGRRTYFDDEIV